MCDWELKRGDEAFEFMVKRAESVDSRGSPGGMAERRCKGGKVGMCDDDDNECI